jgi:hypothetical protein
MFVHHFLCLNCPYQCSQVIHPAPGSDGRPSFTALVANVDSDTAKYIAASRVQTSRQEMIEELESMSHHCLSMYMRYSVPSPQRFQHQQRFLGIERWPRRRRPGPLPRNVSSSTAVSFPVLTLSCLQLILLLDGVSEGQFKQVLEQG